MTRWTNLAFQAFAFTAQVVTPLLVKNPSAHAIVSGVVAFAQGAIAIIAHSYNPDGTAATNEYSPGRVQDGGAN
jgi:hypothetical protein